MTADRCPKNQLIHRGNPASGAIFSPCEKYRYLLWRNWDGNAKRVCWLLLNPSTATELVLDPTLTRCKAYSQAWGYGGMTVCNAFAYRETNRLAMLRHPEPIGPDNDRHIMSAADAADLVVVGWGNDGTHQGRGAAIMSMLASKGIVPKCLKITGNGQPGHPLYLKKDLQPFLYCPAELS